MYKSNWKRIVIKVGSALIAPNRQGCSSHHLLSIAQFIVRCRNLGIQVVLVSSGSVAAGSHLFKNTNEQTIAVKKAMAAAGQTEMMATWDRLFDFPSAQLLLTHGDLRDRERYISIRETLFSLLDNGILPIVNENDTVTTDKLKVGDNDNLSAMVAAAADADSLIICSDVDGLYDKNPQQHADAKKIEWVEHIDESIYAMAGGALVGGVGTGGMRTKIEAAEKAVWHGIDTFIVNGFNDNAFNDLLEGINPGTHFQACAQPMEENVHWMRHTSNAQGEVIVDGEFDTSLAESAEQLTSSEIIEVRGQFGVGDTILVRKDDGTKLAKARSNYSSCLLNFIANEDNQQFVSEFERKTGPIISKQHLASLENE